MQIRSRAALAAALVGALALSACAPGGASSSDSDAADTISIVGFAVPEAANKNIAAEFTKTPEGEGVQFQTSYGPSGDQSRAVAAGLEADYVHFSVPTDVTRLVDEGLVADDWDAGENKGVGVRRWNAEQTATHRQRANATVDSGTTRSLVIADELEEAYAQDTELVAAAVVDALDRRAVARETAAAALTAAGDSARRAIARYTPRGVN